MRPVLVVADHPARTTGFATVATNVAAQLHQRGWPVRYLGLGSGAQPTRRPFPVTDVDDHAALVDEVIADARQRPLVLTIGRGDVPLELGSSLRAVGVRDRVDISCYAAVEHMLVPDELRVLKRRVDRIVPATRFTAEALGLSGIVPISHGVDVATFRAPSPSRRQVARTREFDAAPDDLVIGYFGRNTGHKRPDLALRAFAHMATGAYAWCEPCRWLTVAEITTDGHFVAPSACRHCSSRQLAPGRAHERTLMVMHTELLDERLRSLSGGYDLEWLARRFGVLDRVRFDPTLEPGRGHPVRRLVDRMAALDIHLLLHGGGGWELTILETAACGVPNVVTDYAGPAEYAGPFSHMVPVASQVVQPWGIEGIADMDVAVRALIQLAHDPAHRLALGRRGREEVARFGWDRIGQRWHELLVEVTR